MKTYVLILAMLAAPLAAQNKQLQNTAPPQTAAQSTSKQAAQQPQNVVKATAKPGQPLLPQQPIVFTAKQLDEYEDKILDKAETFYNNRLNLLLWMMGILMGIGGIIIPLVISGFMHWQRKISFAKELDQAEKEILESTEEKMKILKTGLISQIDARDEEQTKGTGSNLAYIYTTMAGVLFIPVGEWGMTIRLYIMAIRSSIDGQCFDHCFKIAGREIVRLLDNPEIANSLDLGILRHVDTGIENIKKQLSEIADTEQRSQMESKVKELQIPVHALLHKKQQTTSPQAEPQEGEKT